LLYTFKLLIVLLLTKPKKPTFDVDAFQENSLTLKPLPLKAAPLK
jgi:hypothetical protein